MAQDGYRIEDFSDSRVVKDNSMAVKKDVDGPKAKKLAAKHARADIRESIKEAAKTQDSPEEPEDPAPLSMAAFRSISPRHDRRQRSDRRRTGVKVQHQARRAKQFTGRRR